MDLKKLQGTARTYIICKNLPVEEQLEVEMFPLSTEDLYLADMSAIDPADDKYEEKLKKRISRLTLMLAKMLHADQAEVAKFSAEYFDELMVCAFDRLSVEKDMADRIKTILEKARGGTPSGD